MTHLFQQKKNPVRFRERGLQIFGIRPKHYGFLGTVVPGFGAVAGLGCATAGFVPPFGAGAGATTGAVCSGATGATASTGASVGLGCGFAANFTSFAMLVPPINFSITHIT